MANDPADDIILNGVNASEGSPNRGKYLLTLSEKDLVKLAGRVDFSPAHLEVLRERDSGLERLPHGVDDNDLAQAGWGVIFPAAAEPAAVAATREALQELLDWRQGQAGKLFQVYEGERGYQKGDDADAFMRRHEAAPGIVHPAQLPYYLLLVGDVTEIPYRFQYELGATYLVGRLYFDTPDEYARYAHSVVAAERDGLRLPRRAVFFGPHHQGDRATELSAGMLVSPLVRQLRQKKQDWQIEHLPPAQSTKASLGRLMGDGDAPALLFTASHGVGFDNGDAMQLPFQGALLCQDLEAINPGVDRQHYLGAEDIDKDFHLHGLVAFHFACFGLGTPRRENFIRRGHSKPQIIAPRDFLAALPRRLLSHPHGGALAVIGHVDRAWSYSFKWGETANQTLTFQDTLQQLMSGRRVGAALDSFNDRHGQIARRLTGMLDPSADPPPDPSDLAGLWTAHNDARGYALLGDPAVMLPVAKAGEAPTERAALTTPPVRVATGQTAEKLATDNQPPATADRHTPVPTGEGQPQAGTSVANDEALRRQLALNLQALSAQLDRFATELTGPAAFGGFEAESFGLLDREKLNDLGEKLRAAMSAIGDRLADFANDVTSLQVRTFTSEQIESEEWTGKTFKTGKQRALTHIKLDGDTDIIVPYEAGEFDEVIWDIHSRAVEQAQANRVAVLKAVGELLAALVPTTK